MYGELARLRIQAQTAPRYSQQQVNAALDGIEAWAGERIANLLATRPDISAEAACQEIVQGVLGGLRDSLSAHYV